MGDLLSLVAPFFSTPRTYSQMLGKLAGSVFYETFFITFLLRDIAQIGAAFASLESYRSLGKFISAIPNWDSLNIAGLVCALIVARVTYATQLHDRISDLLGIRKRFDRDHILIPLAKLVGVRMSESKKQLIEKARDRLMRLVYYRYASSRDDKPLVDRHDIEHALDAWTTFWICIEGSVLFAIGSGVALVFCAVGTGAFSLGVAALLVISAFIQHARLPRYSKPQIEAIAANGAASKAVRAAFDAL